MIENSPQKYKKNMWILRAAIFTGLSKIRDGIFKKHFWT